MQKTWLFAGASSAIAQAVPKDGNRLIGLSRQANLSHPFDEIHTVNGYTKAELPDIGGPIDGLVYFPGSINLRPFHRISEADFLAEYQLNALGAVGVIQKYLDNLKASPGASIVLISTVAAETGMSFHTSISMAKSAVEGLARALAAELAPKIRVNTVAPSLTQTPLAEKLTNSPEKVEAGNKRHPLQRIGRPDDIANAIHFLLSEQSAWITGQVLHVDGGMSTLRSV